MQYPYLSSCLRAILLFATLFASGVALATPPAGTTIGNQATVSWTDAAGNTVSVNSNLVQSTVAVVFLPPTLSGTIDVGAQLGVTVNLPFTVTNTSNTDDAFDLALTDVAGGFDFDAITLYTDNNADGLPDSATPLDTSGSPDLTLAYQGSASFVAVVTLPNSGAGSDQLQISATSTNGANASATDNSTVTVEDDAQGLVTASIALSNTQGIPNGQDNTVDEGTQYTVTLAYENTGDATVTDLTFSTTVDNELLPTGMRYIAASENGADTFNVVGNDVTASITSLASGASGVVTFAVKVPTGTGAGALTVQADFDYDDAGANPRSGTTNQAPFEVLASAGISLTDSNDNADGDGDATVATVVSGIAGSYVDFELRLTNNGNSADRFDVEVVNGDFPTGTTFTVLGGDGATPLTDSNGNSTADIGPVASGATVTLYVRADLTSAATGTALNATVTATSIVSISGTDAVTLNLASIADIAGVDLEGSNGGGRQGDGAGDTTPVDTLALDAGGQGQLRLFVANTGSTQVDLYDLTVTEVGQASVPANWDVRLFRDTSNDGILDDGEPLVTRTLTLLPGQEEALIVSVNAAAAGIAGTHDLVFSVLSSEDGTTTDQLAYTVTLAVNNDLSGTAPVPQSSVSAGGSASYTVTLSNGGTQTTGIINLATSDSNIAGSGYTSLIFPDTDCDGIADGAAITSIASLAPGESTCLLVQVSAPADGDGAPNITTLTATPSNGSPLTVALTTETEAGGFAGIIKRQSIDAACDGTADAAFSRVVATVDPGACLIYEVTVTATDGNLTALVVFDSAPAFSALIGQASLVVTGTGASSESADTASPPAAPAACDATNANRGFDIGAESLSVNVCNLEETATATLTFGVQVEN